MKVAEKEKTFEKIREYITVSVKMDEKEPVEDDYENEESQTRRSVILEEQEEIARKYLEDTAKLVEEMSEGASKQKLDEKLEFIFNKEKKKKEEILIEEQELDEKKKTKEERLKDLGNN